MFQYPLLVTALIYILYTRIDVESTLNAGGLTNNKYIRYVVPYQQYYISGTFILPWIHMKPDHIDTGVLIYTKALKGHGDLKKP